MSLFNFEVKWTELILMSELKLVQIIGGDGLAEVSEAHMKLTGLVQQKDSR